MSGAALGNIQEKLLLAHDAIHLALYAPESANAGSATATLIENQIKQWNTSKEMKSITTPLHLSRRSNLRLKEKLYGAVVKKKTS